MSSPTLTPVARETALASLRVSPSRSTVVMVASRSFAFDSGLRPGDARRFWVYRLDLGMYLRTARAYNPETV